MRRLALLAVVAGLAAPATASANPVLADLEIAHAYWKTGTAVPEPADANGPCRGRWNVIGDPGLAAYGYDGQATGMGFNHAPETGSYTALGTRWDWYVKACEFKVLPGIKGDERLCVIVHEVGHFIWGPEHDGPMSPGALARSPGCSPAVARPTRADFKREVVRYVSQTVGRGRKVTCTPLRLRMRCRAERGGELRRYRVRLSIDSITITRL